MSLHRDLLAQAKLLATKEPKRPKQASLRRSVSASYYAVFHMLIDDAVRRLITARRDRNALRNRLSRAFDHRVMRQVAQQFASDSISPKLEPALNGLQLQDEIIRVASVFADLQQARHEADYDVGRLFTRLEVCDLIDDAEETVAKWRSVRKSVQADTFLVGLLAYDKIRH